MSAIKGVGHNVIQSIVEERERNGKYVSMQDFMTRLTSKEVNKHTIENFIKSGAFDSLGGTRKQKMTVYQAMLDTVNREKKDSMSGQLSLFDMGDEELEHANEIAYPNVGEYEKEDFLAFEKEVLSIYISGHPLEEYLTLMQKNCTNNSMDFMASDEEDGGNTGVADEENAVIGGMIIGKTVKTTKRNELMAFLTIEDLYGTVEVIVFPRVYEKSKEFLQPDSKVFVKGRVQLEELRDGKLICQEVIPFDSIPCELWLKFENKEAFLEKEQQLYSLMLPYDGRDVVCIYLEQEKQIKRLPHSRSVNARRIMGDNIFEKLEGITVALKEKPLS